MYNNYGNWTNPLFNNMQQQPSMRPQIAPHYEIIKVNGEAGARAFQMAPNSDLLLADATNPNVIWLVQTDGAGYLSATQLNVTFPQVKTSADFSTLEERIKSLEEKYEQLNSGFSKSAKKQRNSQSNAEQPTDSTT